ncbi:hypothetical protein VTO42DRAFT_2263 [Malbranchea cinnamomea]
MSSSNKRARLSSDGNAVSKPVLTRACAECKKLKIKCFVQPGQTACNKCLKSGIKCVPHNFAQKFMDEDAAWKARAASTISRLEDAVEQLLQHNNLPPMSMLYSLGEHRNNNNSNNVNNEPTVQTLSPLTTDHSTSSVAPSQRNFTAEGPSAGLRGDQDQDDSDLVPLPMNNLYNLTHPTNSSLIRVDPSDVNGPDLISQGVISLSEAEFLFEHYRTHINPLLWDGMLCAHKTLQEVRQSSSMLVAVVLTVAALHIPNREQSLHATYGAFVSLMRGSCLLRCHNLDVIRALCIGAFYLTSLSWALCSRAVRVATEMNLHKSSLQFARGSLESYERVRLWYVLYVCDHQFALAYGRPPLMHEDAAIRNAEKLLISGLSSKGDRGLVAQVKLFRILASSYFMYGCDPDLELSGQDFERLQSFNISVDQWRLEHRPSGSSHNGESTKDRDILNPSKKANTLYYYLARFHLNSVSLRGISAKAASQDDLQGLEINWERQEAANNAIMAAMSTARLIVNDTSLQDALIGMPIFTHAMIAVCASFLLKMAVVFGESSSDPDSNNRDRNTLQLPKDLGQYGLGFHTKTALTTVQRLVSVLSKVADNASRGHVARQVVTGLGELLQRFSPGREVDTYVYSQHRGATTNKDPSSAHLPMMRPMKRPMPVSGSGGESDSTTCQRAEAGSGPSLQSQLGLPESQSVNGQGLMEVDVLALQDPFDLTGDLDWRFDDAFLWGLDAIDFQS